MNGFDNDWIEAMIVLERFTNDGSPTGLTWTNSSSPATCPRRSSKWFALPLLRCGPPETTFYGRIPPLFLDENNILFPLHPDCVHLLPPALHRRLVFSPPPPLLVVPTASPRTVLLKEKAWRGFAKLDYPFVLGRFARPLFGTKLLYSLEISQHLLRGRADELEIYHFPEVGAIDLTVSSSRVSGVLFRDYVPTGPTHDHCFTFCSLFGTNYFSPDENSILLSLAEKFGGMPWIEKNVVVPLVESFWRLVSQFGVWPEGHAQNVLLAVSENSSTGILWRDCQGFWAEDWANAVRSQADRVLRAGDQRSRERRSFLYDSMLGTYLLEPLIKCAARGYAGAQQRIQEVVRSHTWEHIKARKLQGIFPENYSVHLPMSAPDGRFLPFERLPNFPFR